MWVAGGCEDGGCLDQLKIRLISAMAFVELGLELSFAIILIFPPESVIGEDYNLYSQVL